MSCNQALAVNITLEHDSDWVSVVMSLLNHVEDNYEYSSASGSYIKPGTVLRYDGLERLSHGKPDISVMFVSLPFFQVGKGKFMEAPKDNSLHTTRGLFQQFYPDEITKDQDHDQQFCKFRQTQNGQHLRVPQFWALVLNSTTIITCGPTPLAEMADGWIEIVPEDSLSSKVGYLIHVTDFYKRVRFLDPGKCGSFLALKQTIQRECLLETQKSINQCQLHLGDSDTILESHMWPRILRDPKTTLIYIRISLKVSSTAKRDDVARNTEASPELKKVEYTDLGSDDESPKGKELTLTVGQPR